MNQIDNFNKTIKYEILKDLISKEVTAIYRNIDGKFFSSKMLDKSEPIYIYQRKNENGENLLDYVIFCKELDSYIIFAQAPTDENKIRICYVDSIIEFDAMIEECGKKYGYEYYLTEKEIIKSMYDDFKLRNKINFKLSF